MKSAKRSPNLAESVRESLLGHFYEPSTRRSAHPALEVVGRPEAARQHGTHSGTCGRSCIVVRQSRTEPACVRVVPSSLDYRRGAPTGPTLVLESRVSTRLTPVMNATEVESLVRAVIVHFGWPFTVQSVSGSPIAWNIVVRSTMGGVVQFTVGGERPAAMRATIQETLEAQL